MYNPALNQQMALLDQEYAQKKASLMQNFYQSQQNNNWNSQSENTQTQAQSAPVPTQNVTWIPVNGLQGAKEHQVPANTTHWLMDSTEDAFYVKASDEFGVIKSFKGYRFAEIPQQELSGISEQVDMSKYVSKDEFDELKAMLEQMTNTQQKRPQKGNKEVVNNG